MKIKSRKDASFPSLNFAIRAGEVKELPTKESLPKGVTEEVAHEAILSRSFITKTGGEGVNTPEQKSVEKADEKTAEVNPTDKKN